MSPHKNTSTPSVWNTMAIVFWDHQGCLFWTSMAKVKLLTAAGDRLRQTFVTKKPGLLTQSTIRPGPTPSKRLLLVMLPGIGGCEPPALQFRFPANVISMSLNPWQKNFYRRRRKASSHLLHIFTWHQFICMRYRKFLCHAVNCECVEPSRISRVLNNAGGNGVSVILFLKLVCNRGLRLTLNSSGVCRLQMKLNVSLLLLCHLNILNETLRREQWRYNSTLS